MLELTEKIYDLIESKRVVNALNNIKSKCELINRDGIDIILYTNTRIVVMGDAFVFLSLKLKKRLSIKKVQSISNGLCSSFSSRTCNYNKLFINYIQLQNICGKESDTLDIISTLLDLI